MNKTRLTKHISEIVVVLLTACAGRYPVGEPGAKVKRLGKSIHSGVPRAKFVGVELVLSCVRSGEAFSLERFHPQRCEDRIRYVKFCEIRKSSNSRKCIRYTSIGAIKELIRKKSSPRICQSWRISGCILARYVGQNVSIRDT